METIKINQVTPNPKQPRRYFGGINELAASIKEKGLLEPIMVRPVGGHFEIIHGQRRYMAAKQAGLTEITCVVRTASDEESFELAVIENIQRESLTATEEARAYQQLQESGKTQQNIASLIGKTQSYVAHKLRLLRIPEPITYYLDAGALTENHIRQIVRLENIYGESLKRGLPPDIDLRGKVGDKKDAIVLLAMSRPEGRVILYEPSEVIVEACRVFADYVSKHNTNTLQWVVGGFWWASLAVWLEFSVADLTLAINSYQQRYECCLLMWKPLFDGVDHAIDSNAVQSQWDTDWPECKRAVYHDLRHSASLARCRGITDADKMRSLAKLIHLIDCGELALPSEITAKYAPEGVGLTPVEWGAL